MGAHRPHFLQATASIRLVTASMWIWPAFKSEPARDAAAPAWQTVSLMSFGDSHMPQKNTPFVGASTGLSFGCDSMKKPSEVLLRVKSFEIFLRSLGGSTPTESTSMSSSCRPTFPEGVFSTVTQRFLVFTSSSTSPGSPRTYRAPASFERWYMSSNDFPEARMSW